MKAGALAAGLLMAASPAGAQVVSYSVEGDAIPHSLTGAAGDAARGAALMGDRNKSLCVLCHSGVDAPAHMQGTLAPTLADVGARLSEGQIRLRIVDMKALDPASIMPTYYGPAGGARIAEAWRGKPILSADEIEDLVAYLSTLRG
ncbi:sulfur oxidation c-type cytochrome SoxX [Aquabacter sp. CN5-332]|uniref:sulfur oxidation c-type cytochrome SoxX n=1 Tax=Aquabacter sp. CN5-332 TaxID=3156608 RepID=UPI0032B46798